MKKATLCNKNIIADILVFEFCCSLNKSKQTTRSEFAQNYAQILAAITTTFANYSIKMAKYRNNLPLNAKDRIFLSEGGMMTSFFFGEETKDIKVPECNLFFHFIKDEKIMNWASNYNRKFLDLCLKENDEFGCVLVAFFQYKARKQDVKEVLDIDEEEWVQLNKDYVQRLVDLRSEYESSIPNCPPIPIGGLVVPKGEKGDCFSMDTRMNIDEAEEYHKDQIKMIAEDTMADFLLFALASYSEDVIGVCNVAARYQLPVVVSFTTGTDGRLYGGETIKVSLVCDMVFQI